MNASWLMVNQISRQLISLIIGVWTARYLGPNDYGLIAWAVTFCTCFSILTLPGMEGIVVKQLVQEPGVNRETLGSFAIMRLAGCMLMVFAVILIGLFLKFSSEQITVVVIIAISYIPISIKTIELDFQSRSEMKYSVFSQLFGFAFVSGFRIILLTSAASVVLFSTIYIAETLATALALVVFNYYKGTRLLRWKVRLGYIKNLLHQGWPLILSSFSVTAYMQIGILLLQHLQGEHAVGIYVAATRLVDCWYFIPGAISAATLPVLMKINPADSGQFDRRLLRCTRLASLIGYVLMIPLLISASWIIPLFYGSAYQDAVPVFQIYALAIILVFIGTTSTPFWIYKNLQKVMFWQFCFTAIINIGLNYVLIPSYGIIGAAIAALASQFFIVMIAPLAFPGGMELFWIRVQALIKPGFR